MLLTHSKRSRIRSQVSLGTRWRVELRERVSPKYDTYGTVTAEGDVSQPIQWSSEYHDTELALIYYMTADGRKAGWTCVGRHAPQKGEDSMWRARINYRYYNPQDGRWTRRDYLPAQYEYNSYCFAKNATTTYIDIYGLFAAEMTLVGGAAAASEVAIAIAVVVVVAGFVVLVIWGASEIVNNITDAVTVDEIESVEKKKDSFNYDRCERWCTEIYNKCMENEYYSKRCPLSGRIKCAVNHGACLLRCSSGKWPTET